ncbi:MAG: hypothetical protein VX427_06415 [Acidobacteriota bacterium]|nr:hypothetical protein [Acidobacteriota bacterium]
MHATSDSSADKSVDPNRLRRRGRRDRHLLRELLKHVVEILLARQPVPNGG